MWFLKRANITGFRADQAYDGTDWRTNENGNIRWSASQTLPSAADAGNYFYLPALGDYTSGWLNFVGRNGHYWSSSAASLTIGNAYGLGFGSGYVGVYYYYRYYGFRAGGFE